MPKYDGQRFSPAAPTATVSITNPDTGSTLSLYAQSARLQQPGRPDQRKNQARISDTAQENPRNIGLVKASDPRNVTSSTKTFS